MSRLLERLAAAQAARPWLFVFLAIALSAGSLPFVARLGLNGDLLALLPASMPSVQDLETIRGRFGQPETFALLMTGETPATNRALARALAPRLAELDEVGVVAVDWNVAPYRDFVEANRFLFVDHDRLVRLRDALEERLDYERARANPFFVDLEGAPTALEEEIEALEGEARDAEELGERFPEGFFEHPDDHRYLSIFLRTDIRGGEMGRMQALMSAVDAAIAEARREVPGSDDITIEYGGGVMDMHAEQEALADAAIAATSVTLLLVLISIQVFFLRLRAIPILLLGLTPPILVTFAFAQLTIEFLNASSAFLSAIVIGNGINPHVMWLARFFEDRREGKSPAEALRSAHLAAWPGTLSASAAAGIAYLSCTLTEFRAFRDFGVIGGIGMALAWVAAFAFTPALALLIERWRPSKLETRAEGTAPKASIYGRAMLALALRSPRAVVAGATLVTVVSLALVGRWVSSDPIEYDFRNLQSQREHDRLQEVNRLIAGTADASTSGNGIAVLVRERADVPHVIAQLEEIEARDPTLLGAIHTIDDLLPSDQERKLPVLAELRRLMLEIRPHLSEERQAQLDEQLPPEGLRVVGAEDLPAMVARPFTEVDGTRGSILYVEHDYEQNQFDGRYLIRWTHAARSPTNRDGTHVAIAGSAPVVADLVDAIMTDGPRTVLASFLATLVLLFFTFRRGRDRLLVFGTHLMGVAWMVAAMALLDIRVNFLNFVALPVTFGLGVDYGVNVMRRFVEEEQRGVGTLEAVRAAIRETGGAVILCSLTTVIGYISLFTSPNRAVNSFGSAMSIAEITCLVAAVIVLPAALAVFFARATPSRPAASLEPARDAE